MKMKKTIAITLACAMALSGTGNLFTPKKAKAASAYNLKNPTTDSNGVSTWDCIYFGNYWQNDTNGDGTADRNDEKQPIKWRVLSVNGDDAFILADQNLDAKAYNETYTDVTWENCTMRSWLNGYGASANKDEKDFTSDSFLDNAFSAAEQEAIQTTSVVNENNPYYGTDGGNDTLDKVYVLSISEINNVEYGFKSIFDGRDTDTRKAKNSAYTVKQGGNNWTYMAAPILGYGCWHLRSLGEDKYQSSIVQVNGETNGCYNFISVKDSSIAVRPALHINLSSSNLWSYAGKVSSNGESYLNGNIIGQIKGFDSSDRRVNINDTTYPLSDDISDEDIQSVMSESTESMVVAYLDNGVVTSIRPLQNILKPVISIEPDISEIVYEHSKFSKTKFKLKVTIKCGLKPSYSLEQVQAALPSDSKLGIHISKVNIHSSFEGSGDIPYSLKEGIFDSKEISYEKDIDIDLGIGKSEEISFTAYLRDDYVPEKVNNTTVFTANVNDDRSTEIRKTINITNMDLSRKNAAAKQYVRDNSSEMNTINTILNGTQAAFDDTRLREVLTDNEVKAVTAQVNNWIYTSNSLNSILMDESDDGLLSKLLKDTGISSKKLADKVFAKLGISTSVIPWAKEYTGTLKFEAKDKNTNKDIVIVFTMNTSFYNLGSGEAFSGFGKINYTIKKSGGNIKSPKTDIGGVGMSTYSNYNKFADSLKSILERQIHNCYSKIYGKGIDEISDEMLQGTFGKIVNAKYGSASEMVYTSLKYAYTGYTEEDAKKSIQDVTIILTKNAVSKKTKVSVHCPVDLAVYDGDGNLCAQIVDNKVICDNDDIMVYADNDDKYIMLPDEGDYVVEYIGNDTGTMNCTIEKYEDEELVKSIDYKDIPLSKDKKYSNFFADGGTQGISLYNINCEDGTEITPVSSNGFEQQVIQADKLNLDKNSLELKPGDSYLLNEVFEPYNASNDAVIWESSNEKVVTVDDIGTVTAVAVGEAEITVKNSAGNLSDKCKVTVTESQTTPPAVTSGPVISTASPIPSSGSVITTPPTSDVNIPTSTPDNSGNISGGSSGGSTISTPIPLPSPIPSLQPTPTTTPEVTTEPTLDPTKTPEATIKPTEAPVKTPAPAKKPTKTVKVKKGSIIKDTKSKALYKVLSTKASSMTVEYLKPTNKKVKKVSIKAAITYKNKKYKIVRVADKAFKNCKKLKKVTIGKNVKKIGKKAFANCKALMKVQIPKGLKKNKIPKNAFAGCSKKLKIKVI